MECLHVRAAVFVSAVLLLGGCQVIKSFEKPLKPPVIERFIVGWSVEDRPIECVVIGEGGDVLLIVASIHGDETGGTPLVLHLIEFLETRGDLVNSRRIVIIPRANPDGMARGSRYNARGIDLNRNFNASNWFAGYRTGEVPFSEPETRAIAKVIQTYPPNQIISIHQPFECIDYDGPGEEMALRLSEYSDLPLRKLGGKPGSLGSYAGDDKGIPTITLELPAQASYLSEFELWEAYGWILMAAVLFPHNPEEAAMR
jgi:protein MpaA